MLGELTFRGFVFEAMQQITQQVYNRKVQINCTPQVYCEDEEHELLVGSNITESIRALLRKQMLTEINALEGNLLTLATPRKMEIDETKYTLTCPRANGNLPVYDIILKRMQAKTYLTLLLFHGTLQMSDGLGGCQLDPACNSVSNTLPLHQRLPQQP